MEIKKKPHLHTSWIDPQAREIVRILQESGFETYLVGGCVRDLLAGIHPKDFDIATTAQPGQVKKRIRGSYIIGRRFRLVLVKRGRQQFEVATFRRASRPEDEEVQLTSYPTATNSAPTTLADNFFGTPEEDALRRDFTINALFYDPIHDELIDFTQGRKDLEEGVLRVIGIPSTRIIEDPIRSLRAIRLSHRLNIQIEPSFRESIQFHAQQLQHSILPRKREEYLKLLKLAQPLPAFLELFDLDILKYTLPSLHFILSEENQRDRFIEYFFLRDTFFQTPPQNSVESYLPLLLAFYYATIESPHQEEMLERFMKLELGMFKSEQNEFLSAHSLASKLHRLNSFKRRSFRRRLIFIQQPYFLLSLQMAYFEHILTFPQLLFWKQELESKEYQKLGSKNES